MFGFVIGTACLIGLIATLRRGAGFGYGCGPSHRFAHGSCGGGYVRRGCDVGGGGAYRDHHHGHSRGHDHEGDVRGFRGGQGFGRGFGRGIVAMLSRRLDLTPAQEKVVAQSLREVREVLGGGRKELGDTRSDVARALRAESFDAVLMGETFSRHDTAIEELRKAVTLNLARVHEALDERQREELAELVERGWGYSAGHEGRAGGWW